MDHYHDDVFGSTSQYRGRGASHKQAHRQSMRVNGAPRVTNGGGTLANAFTSAADDGGAGGPAPGASRFSLAHELAAALMPEPSAGAALMDELGIDYDEGAEGIDGSAPQDAPDGARTPTGPQNFQEPAPLPAAARTPPAASPMSPDPSYELAHDVDSVFGSPVPRRRKHEPEPMDALAQDLAFTESFLAHLRRIDGDIHPTLSHHLPSAARARGLEPAGVEQLASAVIRRLTDTAREREGQVRELREAERELRKIGTEVGGEDVLAALDELDVVDGLLDAPPALSTASAAPARKDRHRLDDVQEEEGDWESEMERRLRGDDDDEPDVEDTPALKDSFIASQPTHHGPPTPAVSAARLADLRVLTASLGASLATISEQTQVNGAANADAGRKLRALKNKLGGWRTEWETAERARVRIERWEAGAPLDGAASPMGTPMRGVRRMDGRKIVEEHLRGYERALREASMKIGVIMASTA